jgi:hypothetical protein
MTTSGTKTFTLDVTDLIEEAFERVGQEVVTGYDAKSARRSLNLLLSEWANRGVHLWTIRQEVLPLTQGVAQYTLPAYVVDVLEMVLRRDGVDIDMNRISRSEYLNFPNKAQQGRPSQFFFDRQISPEINPWQTPDRSTDELVFYYVGRIDDAGAFTNTVEVPFRFYPALVAGLAYYLAIKRDPMRLQFLKGFYEEEMERATRDDTDRVPLRLVPGRY